LVSKERSGSFKTNSAAAQSRLSKSRMSLADLGASTFYRTASQLSSGSKTFNRDTLSFRQMKFQLSPAPAALPHSRRKFQCPAVARVSLPGMTDPSSQGLDNHGLEGRATVGNPEPGTK